MKIELIHVSQPIFSDYMIKIDQYENWVNTCINNQLRWRFLAQ